MSEWYYIGHYGQLGPLTRDQIDELIEGDVIARDTYVWRAGMSSWAYAGQVSELQIQFHSKTPALDPPPPPSTPSYQTQPAPSYAQTAYATPMPSNPMIGTSSAMSPVGYSSYPTNFTGIRSNKNRFIGGLLQFVIPGIGRMYMGYWGIGIMQLVLAPVCGIGALWTLIDGIVILCGGVKVDGYGRMMPD